MTGTTSLPGTPPSSRGRSTACSIAIAGRYDLLNSVMTAGLHHRWRERAADRAELRPGDAALDVCCGTGDLALELAGRVSPGGHVVGCDFSEPMLDLAREKAPSAAAERGALRVGRRAQPALRRRALRRGDGRLRRSQPRRSRSRPARDGAGAAPRRPAGDPRDHAADPPAALDLLLALVRPASCPCSAGSPATRRPTPTCPSRCAAFPAPRGLAEKMDAAGLRADPLDRPRRRDHRDPQRRRVG